MASSAPWPLPTTGGATRNHCRLNRLVTSDLEEPHVRLGWVRESSSSSGGRGGIMGRIEEREEGRKASQKSEKKKRSKEEEQEEEQQEVREERGGVSLAC